MLDTQTDIEEMKRELLYLRQYVSQLQKQYQQLIKANMLQVTSTVNKQRPTAANPGLDDTVTTDLEAYLTDPQPNPGTTERSWDSFSGREQLFFTAFNFSPVAMCITTLEDCVHLDVNQAWINMFGHSRAYAIGKSTIEMGLWCCNELARLFQNELISKGEIENFEMPYRKKNGETGTGLTSARLVMINGQLFRLITVTDITVRKAIEEKLCQSEKALRQSEEKFAKAFHCNPDLMSITTLNEGRHVEVNDAFIKLTGYERHEIIGRTVQELNTWADAEQRKALRQQMKDFERVQGFEFNLRTKTGELRRLSLSGEIIDIDGEAHLLSVSRDITESKKMVEKIRFSEEMLSLAFNVCPFIMTISTVEEGRYLKVNNTFCSITGRTQEEVIGRTSIEIGFWKDPSDRDILKRQIIKEKSLRDLEFRFCRKNGEERLGRYFLELIEIGNEPCMLMVIIDITDIRQMEIEMNRLDRLNVVGEIAASIGHEIRNPMTTVRGFLQLLRENQAYSRDYEYFDLMIEELDRGNSIITEFLSLAKNKIVELEKGNLNDIITKLLPLLHARAMIRDQSINLELTNIPDLLLDKKEMRQLILNLVNNGLESMSSGGLLLIKTFVDNGQVVLAVQDHGQGIEQDLLEKLGTPFLTTKEHGNGLGLAVCYRITARHNARIEISTSPTGTTFLVRFSQ